MQPVYYLYMSHLGGLYWETYEIEYEDRYCETCGDSDWLLGSFTTIDELKDLLSDRDWWSEESANEYLNEIIEEIGDLR